MRKNYPNASQRSPKNVHLLKLSDLSSHKPTHFNVTLPQDTLKAFMSDLNMRSIRNATLKGVIKPMGAKDWQMTAQMTASITQECVVTLTPVKTDINQSIHRLYTTQVQQITADDVEMVEDENKDPIPDVLDLHEVFSEELLLSAPLYPKQPGAEVGTLTHTQPGQTAMSDADAKPFAGLASLRDSLKVNSGK